VLLYFCLVVLFVN